MPSIPVRKCSKCGEFTAYPVCKVCQGIQIDMQRQAQLNREFRRVRYHQAYEVNGISRNRLNPENLLIRKQQAERTV